MHCCCSEQLNCHVTSSESYGDWQRCMQYICRAHAWYKAPYAWEHLRLTVLKNIGALEFVGIDNFWEHMIQETTLVHVVHIVAHHAHTNNVYEKHCVNSTQGAFASMHSPLLGFTTHAGSILWGERINETTSQPMRNGRFMDD